MIAEPLHIAAAFAAGIGLGAVYLWTLWVLVRRLPRMQYGGFWLLGSAFLRIGLLLTSFYLVANGNPVKLLACLLGFFIIRFAVTKWASRDADKRHITL